MRTTGILALFMLCASALFSQDTLYTRDGEVIHGKVTEVSQQEIKYRKSANPDGPVYILPTREIVLIHYLNGSKDVFKAGEETEQVGVYAGNNRVNVIVAGAPFIGFRPFGWVYRPFHYRGVCRQFGYRHRPHISYRGYYGPRRR